MSKAKSIAVVAFALAAALAVSLWLWRRSAPAPTAAPAKPAKVAEPQKSQSKPSERPRGERSGGPPAELQVAFDDDPAGGLRLEGQVVDADEHPVAGALVQISSNPRRRVRSELDGSFVFDRLVGRSYALRAVKDDAVAGATVRLTAKTEPVILRLKTVGGVEVTVQSLDDHRPIEGAHVELHDEPVAGGTTSADGKVTLRGVDRGWHGLDVSAAGFADETTLLEAGGRAGGVDKQTVELRRGAGASGKVVDPSGQPVAGARVKAVAAASFAFAFRRTDRDGAVSDAAGRWSLPGLAAGTFRFRATHEKHAPGSSAPVTLDGHAEKKDITVTLEAGARLAGQVVRRDGTPVAAAAVRVAVKQVGFGVDLARQAFTDGKGGFDIAGLPRVAVDVVATGETASSDTVPVDLAARPEVRDLRVVLDVDGAIAGLVVDGKGQPIAGAQVLAGPELGGRRDNMASWRLRGLAQDVTDGSGRFELHGLPDGGYRLRAARTGDNPIGMWQRPGTAAQVGDKDVKLVVEDDGTIKGKVLFTDGSAPKSYQVATGFGRGVGFSASDGSFEVDAPAGSVTASVSGPEFVQKTVSDVQVKTNDATDVGTITVERGRSISGRVLHADGTPVAGARVLAGPQLMGSGAEIGGGGLMGAFGAGPKTATSGDDGGYTLVGVGEKSLMIVADSETDGRSPMSRVPAGPTSVQLDLTLQALGALEGRATSAGQPLGSIGIIAQPQQASRGTFIVRTDDSGAYRYDKLAPDTYVVSTMTTGAARGMSLRSATVDVQSGQTAHLDLDVPAGTITVTLAVKAPPGANVHTAQIFLLTGAIRAANAEELGEVVAARGGGGLHSGFSVNDVPLTMDKIEPGAYSACAIPIPGDMNDASAMMKLQGQLDKLIVVCIPAQVATAPDQQSITIPVPAPPPL